MKIIRHQTAEGVSFARQLSETEFERLEGHLFDGLKPTGEAVQLGKILAPLEPTAILGIGHEGYQHMAMLSAETRKALASDFDA